MLASEPHSERPIRDLSLAEARQLLSQRGRRRKVSIEHDIELENTPNNTEKWAKNFVDETLFLIQNVSKKAMYEEKSRETKQKLTKEVVKIMEEKKEEPIVPGPKVDLTIPILAQCEHEYTSQRANNVDFEIMTEWEDIAFNAGILTVDTSHFEKNEIATQFADSNTHVWPRKEADNIPTIVFDTNLKEFVEQKTTVEDTSDDPSKDGTKIHRKGSAEWIDIEEEIRKSELEQKMNERDLPTLLSEKESSKLIESHEFLPRFEQKSKWLQRILAVNEEYSEHPFELQYQELSVTPSSTFPPEPSPFTYSEEPTEGPFSTAAVLGAPIAAMRRPFLKRTESTAALMSPMLEKSRRQFTSTPMCKGRSINGIEFSPVNRDVFLVSHAKRFRETFSAEQNGLINVWNYLLPKYPEYQLRSQSMVTSCLFHPVDPKLIVGATESGQILWWDIRAKKTPSRRSRFSTGHHNPVYGMQFLPTMNDAVQHIMTISNDGMLCMWTDQDVSEPYVQVRLRMPGEGIHDRSTRADELCTTCFTYPLRNPSNLVIGSDDGQLFFMEMHSSAKQKSLGRMKSKMSAHFGPITNVQFSPVSQNRFGKREFKLDQLFHHRSLSGGNLSSLFLTSSYDWTIKLWHHQKTDPIAMFGHHDDYIHDVRWSPTYPGIFTAADGTGDLSVYDIYQSWTNPVCRKPKVTNNALTQVRWSLDGKHVICGDSAGEVTLFNVDDTFHEPTMEYFNRLEERITKRLKKMSDSKEKFDDLQL